MLMDIKCSEVSSIKVELTFDDESRKVNVVSIGDLIDVVYNANGLRKEIEGKVAKISTVGVDPKGWYIIVDGSGSFVSETAKFSPMSILDLSIIRKASTLDTISTPIGTYGIPYLRVVKNRLQYSTDGYTWVAVQISSTDVVEDIDPATGGLGPHGTETESASTDDSETIEDADY